MTTLAALRDFTWARKKSQAPIDCERKVREHLGRLLTSPHFDAPPRVLELLHFIVTAALRNPGVPLDDAAIAKAVFGRKGKVDLLADPIVRIQTGRLRRSLERYYERAVDCDSIRIEIPKGTCTPAFVGPSDRQPPEAAATR